MKYVILFVLAVAIQQSANIASGQIQSQNPLCIASASAQVPGIEHPMCDEENWPEPKCAGDKPWIIDEDCVNHKLSEICSVGQDCLDQFHIDLPYVEAAYELCHQEALLIQDPELRAAAENVCYDIFYEDYDALEDALDECAGTEEDWQEAANSCCANPLMPHYGTTPFSQLDVANPRGQYGITPPTPEQIPPPVPVNDEFICDIPSNQGGCTAVRELGGGEHTVIHFNQGNMISTDDGLSFRRYPNDRIGWTRLD